MQQISNATGVHPPSFDVHVYFRSCTCPVQRVVVCGRSRPVISLDNVTLHPMATPMVVSGSAMVCLLCGSHVQTPSFICWVILEQPNENPRQTKRIVLPSTSRVRFADVNKNHRLPVTKKGADRPFDGQIERLLKCIGDIQQRRRHPQMTASGKTSLISNCPRKQTELRRTSI